MQVHDAQSGFHDIKPLPEFLPFPWVVLGIFCAIIILAAAAYYFYQRSREGFAQTASPPIPADQRALAQLRKLEQDYSSQQIGIRELGTAASLTLRTYLSEALAFPATELTNREVLNQLRSAFKKKFPAAPESRQQDFERAIERLLKFFERITFAGGAEQAFDSQSDTIAKRLGNSQECVQHLENLLQQERQRTASVISQANPDQSALGERAA